MNPIKKLGFGKWLARARRGVAAVEFALTLPIWTTLLLGAGDGSYYMLVSERTDRIAYSVTDIVTQYQSISLANLNDILLASGQLMQPFSATDAFGNPTVIVVVSSVYQAPGSTPRICWQYTNYTSHGGAPPPQPNSKIGNYVGYATPPGCAAGAVATLPNGLTLNDNDNVIISEVFYDYKPLFVYQGLFPGNTIYRTAVYKPRLSPLIVPPT